MKEKEWTKHIIYFPVEDDEEDEMDRKLARIEKTKKRIKRGEGIRGT